MDREFEGILEGLTIRELGGAFKAIEKEYELKLSHKEAFEGVSQMLGCKLEDVTMLTGDVMEVLEPQDEFDLDDLVLETCESIASEVNNQGFEKQIRFLLEKGVTPSHIYNVMGVSTDGGA